MAKITRKQIEQASVVFKQIQFGETYEVLKTRDSQLSLGGKYSEDLVKYYALMNENVVIVDTGEEVIEDEQSLKVGDYAKVTLEWHNAFGEIVKIVSDSYSDSYKYDTELLNGDEGDCHNPDHLVRVTDEEVAEAKRWAKIGRKPNEFKKGDIVRVRQSHGAKRRLMGIVENGSNVSAPDLAGVREVGGQYHAYDVSEMTLITPVEHRFDLAEGDSE
jgi:hypothetical protein